MEKTRSQINRHLTFMNRIMVSSLNKYLIIIQCRVFSEIEDKDTVRHDQLKRNESFPEVDHSSLVVTQY